MLHIFQYSLLPPKSRLADDSVSHSSWHAAAIFSYLAFGEKAGQNFRSNSFDIHRLGGNMPAENDHMEQYGAHDSFGQYVKYEERYQMLQLECNSFGSKHLHGDVHVTTCCDGAVNRKSLESLASV